MFEGDFHLGTEKFDRIVKNLNHLRQFLRQVEQRRVLSEENRFELFDGGKFFRIDRIDRTNDRFQLIQIDGEILQFEPIFRGRKGKNEKLIFVRRPSFIGETRRTESKKKIFVEFRNVSMDFLGVSLRRLQILQAFDQFVLLLEKKFDRFQTKKFRFSQIVENRFHRRTNEGERERRVFIRLIKVELGKDKERWRIDSISVAELFSNTR